MTYQKAFQNLLKSCLTFGGYFERYNEKKKKKKKQINTEATERRDPIVKRGKIPYDERSLKNLWNSSYMWVIQKLFNTLR